MKNAAEGKHKLYVAVVYTETSITPELLRPLETHHDRATPPTPPARVVHRRPRLTREKMIYLGGGRSLRSSP